MSELGISLCFDIRICRHNRLCYLPDLWQQHLTQCCALLHVGKCSDDRNEAYRSQSARVDPIGLLIWGLTDKPFGDKILNTVRYSTTHQIS